MVLFSNSIEDFFLDYVLCTYPMRFGINDFKETYVIMYLKQKWNKKKTGTSLHCTAYVCMYATNILNVMHYIFR